MKIIINIILLLLLLTSCSLNNINKSEKNLNTNEKALLSTPKESIKPSPTINPIQTKPIEKVEREVSRFETYYSKTKDGRDENIAIACQSIDGTILQPDEVFSFNDIVGERTEERGYKEAKIFLNGEKVLGFGGGVCQVSSTIFNAALMANLEILERHPHPKPIDYLPEGKDAAVNFGTMDLKFKNTYKNPIKLDVKSENLTVLVTIFEII